MPPKKSHKARNGGILVVVLLFAFGAYNRLSNSHDAPATPIAGHSDSFTCTDDDVTTTVDSWVAASNRAQLTVSAYADSAIDDATAGTRLKKRLGQMRDSETAIRPCLANPSQEQLRLIEAMLQSNKVQATLYTTLINVSNGGSATNAKINKQIDEVNASTDAFGPLWRAWGAAHNFELEKPPTSDDGQ